MRLSDFREDFRAAWRSVRANLGFFGFAAAIAGVGIAASTAVFSVLGPLMIRPLPFPNSDELVWIDNDGEGGLSSVTSRTSNLRDFRELNSEFESLSGYNAFFQQARYNLSRNDSAESLVGVDVAHNLLDVLGVKPLLGRNFDDAEGQQGGPPAIILAHGFWVRRFAEDREIVGTSISLNNQAYEVVGVLPSTFDFSSMFIPDSNVDFLVPFPVSEQTDNWGNTLTMVGRLNEGATVATAQADLENVIRGLEEADPERWGLGAKVYNLQEKISDPFKQGLLLLAAAAATIMLIVCVNLSNLLLSRAPGRRREMSVRTSLGATPVRLLRQLLFESSILSLAGAGLGIGLAWTATRLLAGNGSLEIPLLEQTSIDLKALGFSIFLAAVAGLVVGLAPALQLALGSSGEGMNRGRATSAGRGSNRLREALVVAQVGLACALLVFGGLLLRSFQSLLDLDLGFRPSETVAWQLNSSRDFETLAEQTGFYLEISDAVRALPGVENVGMADDLPLGTNRTWGVSSLTAEFEEGEGFSVFPHIVDGRYTETLGIRLLEGRHFSRDDDQESEPVVIFNETAAKAIFGDVSATDRMVNLFDQPTKVIGIVKDVRHRTMESTSGNEMYLPFTQVGAFQTLELVVRSKLPAETLAPSVAGVISRFDPGMPAGQYRSLGSLIDRELSPRRFTFSLLAGFAATALLLAALGIYGVLSCSVSERIPEIGIRMALGETASQVGQRVVGRTLALVGVGVALGLGGSYVLSNSVRSMLFGISPSDPMTYLAMAVLLLLVGAVAGFVPARRASRTDPVEALERA